MFGIQITGGSSSVVNSYDQLRTVGAQARTMLVQAAAEQWKVKPERLPRREGLRRRARRQARAYGQLAEAAGSFRCPRKSRSRSRRTSDHRQAHAALDSADKVDGRASSASRRRQVAAMARAKCTSRGRAPARVRREAKSFNAEKVRRCPR
jgi:isoquinoline 1-oxidoreductase beta subunit